MSESDALAEASDCLSDWGDYVDDNEAMRMTARAVITMLAGIEAQLKRIADSLERGEEGAE